MTNIPDAVTDHEYDRINDIYAAIRQAIYEGSHVMRQDPEPHANSPWTTPDVPIEILSALEDLSRQADALRRLAHEYRTGKVVAR